MSFRQLLKPRSHCSSVRRSSLPQILESLLPQFLDVREMPDILGDGPLPFHLAVRRVLPDSLEQGHESWYGPTKALNEVREHPARVHKRELALSPLRANDTRTHELTVRAWLTPMFSCTELSWLGLVNLARHYLVATSRAH